MVGESLAKSGTLLYRIEFSSDFGACRLTHFSGERWIGYECFDCVAQFASLRKFCEEASLIVCHDFRDAAGRVTDNGE